MTNRIEIIGEKKLVGLKLTMSVARNATGELWRRFMPRRKEIRNSLTSDLISMQVYPPEYFTDYKPTAAFEKWAAVEVKDFTVVPDGMEPFVLQGGRYIVFHYTGLSTDSSIFQHIFGTWIPNSKYVLDARPHFEILGGKYKNDDPNSEEEIWIPIKPR